ncbi:matrilin-1-like [Mytilus galloprovincialis]|uniref:matrilin-1-like n=1 Tax=Mytilus galloprovincialis TaxID=29158 RepID=UPI003F7BA496
MMTFSDEPEMLFQLDEFKTKDEIERILRDITADFWKGGRTYIDKALRLLMDEGLSMSHGSRTGVPQIAVIITDGKATDPDAFEKVVQQLQRTNYIVFAIGVGPERDSDELSKIASDASHIFEVEDVDSLEAIRKELLIEICDIQDRPSPPSPVEECKGAQGDLIFVADSSRSIGHAAFDQLKEFAMEVVKRFTISPHDMRVGFIVFGNDTDFEFKLNTYRDQDEVIKAISKVQYLQGMQLTYTDKALTLLVRTGFTNQNGGRGGKIPKIAVVITDGLPRNVEATRAIANKAKQQGIIVFAIGVGPYINQAGLDIMASDPTEFHSLLVSNHATLSSFEDELAEKTCTGIVYCQNKADVFERDNNCYKQICKAIKYIK